MKAEGAGGAVEGRPLELCLKGDDGKEHCLSHYRGKWVVLYFYPRDNTPGCTAEAKEFSALLDEFKALNAVVMGVSRDTCESHRAFRERHRLRHLLLCDGGAEAAKALGFWGKKAFGREGVVRSTVLIDPQGRVAKVWRNVRARGHAQRVLDHLKALGDAK